MLLNATATQTKKKLPPVPVISARYRAHVAGDIPPKIMYLVIRYVNCVIIKNVGLATVAVCMVTHCIPNISPVKTTTRTISNIPTAIHFRDGVALFVANIS